MNLQAVYTDGASRYNFQSLFPTSISMFGGTNNPLAYQSLGFASINDAVFVNGSNLETVKTWGFRGGFTHNWDPYWASSIYGAYGAVQYGGLAKTAICGVGGVGGTARTTLGLTGNCNPDFNIAVIGGTIVWTPVKNLAFTLDVNWTQLDQKYEGTVFVQPLAANAKPFATYELKDQGAASMLLRAQRNF